MQYQDEVDRAISARAAASRADMLADCMEQAAREKARRNEALAIEAADRAANPDARRSWQVNQNGECKDAEWAQ
jgi:hypothetical protein